MVTEYYILGDNVVCCSKGNWCDKCLIEQMWIDSRIHFSSKQGKKVHSGLIIDDGSIKSDCGLKVPRKNYSTYTRIESLMNMCTKCKSHLIARLKVRKPTRKRVLLATVSLGSCEYCGCNSYHELFTVQETHYSCRVCGYIIRK